MAVPHGNGHEAKRYSDVQTPTGTILERDEGLPGRQSQHAYRLAAECIHVWGRGKWLGNLRCPRCVGPQKGQNKREFQLNRPRVPDLDVDRSSCPPIPERRPYSYRPSSRERPCSGGDPRRTHPGAFMTASNHTAGVPGRLGRDASEATQKPLFTIGQAPSTPAKQSARSTEGPRAVLRPRTRTLLQGKIQVQNMPQMAGRRAWRLPLSEYAER